MRRNAADFTSLICMNIKVNQDLNIMNSTAMDYPDLDELDKLVK
jgi:hypothetical protein